MTIRRRLSVAAAVAVAVSIALASLAAHLAVEAKLRGEVDSSLRDRVEEAQAILKERPQGLPRLRLPSKLPQARFGGAAGYVQLVTAKGLPRSLPRSGQPKLPVSDAARAIATGKSDASVFEDQTVEGEHLRILTAPLAGLGAIQAARPLDEVDSVLSELAVILAAITAGGIVLAAILGGAVSRTSLAPVRRFTEQTEAISAGPDLSRRLDVESKDELGRLARSYNSTLDALERSADAQRQMVSDASHELRTPLTLLKTNLELLLRSESRLLPTERAELEHDLVEQIDELTLLVDDVVELARRGEPDQAFDEVPFEEIVQVELERYERRRPEVEFSAQLEPCTVQGVPERLARAVHNLLDNAVKWSPPGGRVEVRLDAGVLTVRDHGPGFDPGDLPFVFDRFYRAPDARSRRGSGLGLAIVRQTAEAHGAVVEAANAEGGGAILTLRFPAQIPLDD